MISTAEIAQSLRGVARICMLDPKGLELIDLSASGALRSFWLAAYLVLPNWLLFVVWDGPDVGGQFAGYTMIWMIFYALNWVTFPWLVLSITRFVGQPKAGYGIIAVTNWFGLGYFCLAILLLVLAKLTGAELFQTIRLTLLLLTFPLMGYFYWHTAKFVSRFKGQTELSNIAALSISVALMMIDLFLLIFLISSHTWALHEVLGIDLISLGAEA